MGKKLYVGNLSYGMTDSDLEQLCGQHGTVQSAQVIMDRDTGRSKGFGFVEMGSDAEAQAAITSLNGKDVWRRRRTLLLNPRLSGVPARAARPGTPRCFPPGHTFTVSKESLALWSIAIC